MPDLEEEAKLTKAAVESEAKEVKPAPSQNIPREKIEPGLRTYASDIADLMRKEKGSIIKIALAEQKRRDEYKKENNPVATKNIIVMLVGIGLIVGGIMIFVRSIMNRAAPVNQITNLNPSLPSFIFAENQVHIDMTELNRTELINAIKTQVANDTQIPGTINNLFISYQYSGLLVQAPITVFLQKLGINTPDNLFQNFESNFMLGVYNEDGPNELFLIFKLKDFNEGFAAMRDFEPSMLSEFVRLFDIDTSAYGRDIFNANFTTETLFNREARVLRDPDGKALLSYVFLDPKTVMITTKGDSIEEVSKRISLQTLK